MTDNQISEALKRLEKFAQFVEQLEPLTPKVDAVIADLCADAARIAKRLEELRDAHGDG